MLIENPYQFDESSLEDTLTKLNFSDPDKLAIIANVREVGCAVIINRPLEISEWGGYIEARSRLRTDLFKESHRFNNEGRENLYVNYQSENGSSIAFVGFSRKIGEVVKPEFFYK